MNYSALQIQRKSKRRSTLTYNKKNKSFKKRWKQQIVKCIWTVSTVVWLCPRKMRRLGLGDGAVQELNNIGQYIFFDFFFYYYILAGKVLYNCVSLCVYVRV